jgi:Na+-driven multidrug efflux pump
MFQAMGNTVPSLVASGTRMVVLIIPVLLMSRMSGFALHWVWWLSLATAYFQLALVLVMLRRQFARRLEFGVAAPSINIEAPVAEVAV